ncbi:MAG: VOC family protein [Holophaga sp.]|nr:VOC family protein [Holophaga sp.]
MARARIDHLVVTAPTLAAGVDFVRAALGVGPQPGGRHPRMATHNCLLRLGPATYLEVIAIDPEAEAELPRWFQLDRGGPPRLATWVARTGDIQSAAARAPDFGRIEPMARGDLRWEITLPEGGGLPFDGIAPTLIQWRTEPHPAALLADSGCALVRLEGFHPRAAELSGLLGAIGLQDPVELSAGRPRLAAHIQTPAGPRVLG